MFSSILVDKQMSRSVSHDSVSEVCLVVLVYLYPLWSTSKKKPGFCGDSFEKWRWRCRAQSALSARHRHSSSGGKTTVCLPGCWSQPAAAANFKQMMLLVSHITLQLNTINPFPLTIVLGQKASIYVQISSKDFWLRKQPQ